MTYTFPMTERWNMLVFELRMDNYVQIFGDLKIQKRIYKENYYLNERKGFMDMRETDTPIKHTETPIKQKRKKEKKNQLDIFLCSDVCDWRICIMFC